jgi:hypothetical protein
VVDSTRTKNEGFARIARYYRSFYRDMREDDALPYRLTALGAWATSRAPHVYAFFRAIGLQRYRLFVDLGSGDGVVTCIAGLFTRAVGIEGDPGLCLTAGKAARVTGMSAHVDFICGNYLDLRIGRADCLYLYPDKPFNRLERALEGWSGGLLVNGPHIPPLEFAAVRKLRCGRETLTVYGRPL